MSQSLDRALILHTIGQTAQYALPVGILALSALFAIAPGAFAPYDPIFGDIGARLLPPSVQHFFGTDDLGRDVFSRFVHGAQLSLTAASLAVVIGFTTGIVIGSIAGAAGGRIDAAIMRVIDVLLSVPTLLMAITIIAVLGFGTVNIAIAVGLANIATVTRLMRTKVIGVRQELYVTMAALAGIGPVKTLLRHIIPNSISGAASLAVLELGTAIISVASLSFLGFGANPPHPEWGSMISDGQPYLIEAWWISTLPGLCICVIVISLISLSRGIVKQQVGTW